jgi:uncharacterized protein
MTDHRTGLMLFQMRHVIALLCVGFVGCFAVAPSAAQAIDELAGGGGSYVTPFPPGDVYKLQVYGEGFAEGLIQGLGEVARTLDRVDVPRKHRNLVPLVRAEVDDELKVEEQSREIVHIGIVMLGPNDRGSLRIQGSPAIKFGTTTWKEQYGQRLDRLLKALKRRSVAVYVIGMPPLRRQEANAEAESINEVLLERAQANGVRFLEVAESFSDDNGAFTQFGSDSSGNREKLRDGDGVSFTSAGNRKLASLIATELKRDLAAARAERAVPLAGGETEQRRINPEKPSAWKSVVAKDVKDSRPSVSAVAPSAGTLTSAATVRAAGGAGDQRSDPGRLALKFAGVGGREETASIEIVRPAIAAAVIALLTRKDVADAASQPFEYLADDIGDGVSVSTMVTALAEPGGAGGRRRGASALANYASVWVKGERLQPKPGRADDFSWPRLDAIALPAPAPTTSSVPPAAPGKRQGPPDVQSAVPKTRPVLPPKG